MLDSTSLEVISRFKQALLSRESQTSQTSSKDKLLIDGTETLPVYNRGLKLLSTSGKVAPPTLDVLRPKTTEYNGKKYVVLTNENIEADNLRKKRRWNDTYGEKQTQDEEELEYGDSLVDGQDEEDIHPLKKSRIIELLSPLNHPSEIITHPAISKTYKLQTLSKLAYELIELIEIEQNNLNWLNKLLQVLNGEDWFYLLEENLGLKDYDHGLDEEKTKKIESKIEKDNTDEFEDEEENAADPFFALPTALKRYEAYQQSLESNDPLKEDLINYLQVSIQRQHEYIKNLTLLRNGLVRADRLKKDLYKWGKEMHDKKSS